MREDAELDLAVVGRDDPFARRRHEGRADFSALFRADRDVLQVRFGRGQAPRGGGGELVGGVDAARLRVEVSGQGVRIGRLELGELAPVEDALRQLVALRREVVEHARGGAPSARLGLLGARQLHLAEQDVAELLWGADVERLAGEFVDVGLERSHALGEFAGKPRQHRPLDRDAALLHGREHRGQRPLQRLVDGRHALGDEPRLEQAPQPEGEVRVLGRVGARLVDLDLGETLARPARAGDLVIGDRRMAEPAARQLVEALRAEPRVEGVRHQHRVVVRRERDAEPA